MRKTKLENEEYYHVYNRGVERRDIFVDKRDYERFLYLLFACNDSLPLLNSQFFYRGFASIETYPRERKPIVSIVCFCLMPNHFHLLLKQRVDGGISKFMQKLGTGYTMYFNKKYSRSGVLFQGVFKSRHIDKEEYLTHLTRYIHINPAELREPAWKEKGILSKKDTYDFIKQYQWSSYPDYLRKGRFHKLLELEILSELYPSPKHYENFVKEWTSKDLIPIEEYVLEA